jgi:hypothetical protein
MLVCRTYTRVSVFPARLGDAPVADWRGWNATNLDDLVV